MNQSYAIIRESYRKLISNETDLRDSWFAGFSADGRHVLTADTQSAYEWRTNLEDVVAFGQLVSDRVDKPFA